MRFDLLEPDLYQKGQPYDVLAWMRENEPLSWHDEPDGPGFWNVTRHADVKAVESNSSTFSSQPLTVIQDSPPVGDADHRLLIFSDAPDHTVRRKFLGVELSPVRVRNQREHVMQVVTELIDDVIERGECDLVEELAGRLASFVIADMMGISRSDALELFPAAEILTRGVRTDVGEGADAQRIVFEHAGKLWSDRRGSRGEDWLSRLAHGSYDGIDEDEMYFQLDFFHLITAGSDTSRNVVSTGMLTLMEHPDAYAELTDDPSRMPDAVEEILRWTPPIGHQRRTVTTDVEIQGRTVRKGQKVVGWYSAANRDPRVFDDPDTFDIHRFPNPHLTFGAGRHFCLGSHLARLELMTMFGELVRRIPDMEPAGPIEYFDYPTLPATAGPAAIPVKFTPRHREGTAH